MREAALARPESGIPVFLRHHRHSITLQTAHVRPTHTSMTACSLNSLSILPALEAFLPAELCAGESYSDWVKTTTP